MVGSSLENAPLAYSETPKTVKRLSNGQVLVHAAGCVNCHTDSTNNGALLAGGKKIKHPSVFFIRPILRQRKLMVSVNGLMRISSSLCGKA